MKQLYFLLFIFATMQAQHSVAAVVCYQINPLLLKEDDKFRDKKLLRLEQNLSALKNADLTSLDKNLKQNPLVIYYHTLINFNCHGHKEFQGRMSTLSKQGVAAAGISLGDMLLEGINIEKNPAAAVDSYKLTAASGSTTALLRLGQFYIQRKEFLYARDYYKQAEDKGDKRGTYNLGLLLYYA